MGGWDKTQSRGVTQIDQIDITDHVTSYSIYKEGRRRRKGRILRVMVFASPGEGWNTCPTMGSS